MSRVLKLTHASESDLNLLNSSGINTEWSNHASYVPGIVEPGQYATDTFRAHVNSSSADNLATVIHGLRDYQNRAREYVTVPSIKDPVWLQAQTSNESGARRAHVRRINWRVLNPPDDWSVADDSKMIIEITIERGIWERTTERTVPTASNQSGAVVTYDPTSSHNTVGDDHARFIGFRVDNASGAGNTLDRLWCGLKSAERYGANHTNFEPIWECEDGTNVGNSTTDNTSETNLASPGGGSGEYVNAYPSAGNGIWENALSIELSDIYASISNYVFALGLYLWLLRCKVESSNTYQVQLRFGFTGMNQNNMYRTDPVEVTNTDWDFIAIDTVDLPLGLMHLADDDGFGTMALRLGEFEIEVWIKRTSGSGDINLDCLIPFPVDEGYLIAENLSMDNGERVYYLESPDGQMRVLGDDTSSFKTDANFDAMSFGLPPGDSRMYILFARDAQTVLTDAIDITGGTFYERWVFLRGGE